MVPMRLGLLVATVLLTASSAPSAEEAAKPASLPSQDGATGACIWALGDSLTAQYAPKLQKITARPVILGGLGGQGSGKIAARIGARDVTITLQDGLLPAAGAAVVTSVSPDLLNYSGNKAQIDGAIDGVSGTLSWQKKRGYRFARRSSGAETRTGEETPFHVDLSKEAPCSLVLWMGRNSLRGPAAAIVTDVVASAARWQAIGRPVLVLGVINGRGEGRQSKVYPKIVAVNDELQRTFGSDYFDIRRWLIDEGAAASGTALSKAGRNDIADDTVPADLRRDIIHLTGKAADAVARQVKSELIDRQW